MWVRQESTVSRRLGSLCQRTRDLNVIERRKACHLSTTSLSLPLKALRKPDDAHRIHSYTPFPSFVLAEPLPRIRSHIRKVLSAPTLRATFPEG